MVVDFVDLRATASRRAICLCLERLRDKVWSEYRPTRRRAARSYREETQSATCPIRGSARLVGEVRQRSLGRARSALTEALTGSLCRRAVGASLSIGGGQIPWLAYAGVCVDPGEQRRPEHHPDRAIRSPLTAIVDEPDGDGTSQLDKLVCRSGRRRRGPNSRRSPARRASSGVPPSRRHRWSRSRSSVATSRSASVRERHSAASSLLSNQMSSWPGPIWNLQPREGRDTATRRGRGRPSATHGSGGRTNHPIGRFPRRSRDTTRRIVRRADVEGR